MHDRTTELRQLMLERELSIEDVACLLNRTRQTVWSWRCRTGGRPIPVHALDLLKSKLAKQCETVQ